MYEVLVIDPPWPKRKGGLRRVRENQGRSLDYETMTVGENFALLDAEVFPKAAATHSVFLWNIEQFLDEADVEMFARGYKRHCRIVWDKGNGVAPAFTVRFTHEYLVWYYKPKFLQISPSMRGKLSTVWSEASRQHSRKPDVAYTNISSLYPDAQRLDVFSREKRPGYDQWGNQPNHFKH